jgi:aldose 1-epimerase
MRISEERAGEVGGRPVLRYRLANDAGMTVEILSYGATVQSLRVPDRDGNDANVVLGFATLREYVELNAAPTVANPGSAGVYFGSLIGRYANRLAGGHFELDGVRYEIPRNGGDNALHGGDVGFDQRVFTAAVVEGDGRVGVRLEYESPAGEMGFPGTLQTVATYLLEEENRLILEMRATTDAPTVVNLTNHSYWNLAGESSGPVLDHLLSIEAEQFLPGDEALTPTGEIRAVSGTPFDFRRPVPIGARIREPDPQLAMGHGYDHNFVLRQASPPAPVLAATALDPVSGRGLRVHTTQPGVQFYSGNFLDGSVRGSGGRLYRQSDGFALETQHFPDAPNHPGFPSTVLRPGESYEETIVYEMFLHEGELR